MGQQRPGHARHLVGERHRHDLEGSPRQELREPGIPRSEYGYAPEIGDRSTWFAHGQGGLLNMGSVCACLDASGHFIQLVVPQLSVSASELRGVVSLAHDLSPSNQRGSSNRWWGHTGSTLCGAVYFNVLEDFSLSGSF